MPTTQFKEAISNDQMYSAVLKWKVEAVADHLLVPRTAKVDGNNIGNWINSMRKWRRSMTRERVPIWRQNIFLNLTLLEWNDVNDAKWSMRFDDLQQLFMKNGHSSVPRHLKRLFWDLGWLIREGSTIIQISRKTRLRNWSQFIFRSECFSMCRGVLNDDQ